MRSSLIDGATKKSLIKILFKLVMRFSIVKFAGTDGPKSLEPVVLHGNES